MSTSGRGCTLLALVGHPAIGVHGLPAVHSLDTPIASTGTSLHISSCWEEYQCFHRRHVCSLLILVGVVSATLS